LPSFFLSFALCVVKHAAPSYGRGVRRRSLCVLHKEKELFLSDDSCVSEECEKSTPNFPVVGLSRKCNTHFLFIFSCGECDCETFMLAASSAYSTQKKSYDARLFLVLLFLLVCQFEWNLRLFYVFWHLKPPVFFLFFRA
jgi:hypothetical protein